MAAEFSLHDEHKTLRDLKSNTLSLKDNSATGAGDTLNLPLERKVQGSGELFDLITEVDSRLHGHGSSLTPNSVRDETGIVYKRPATEPATTMTSVTIFFCHQDSPNALLRTNDVLNFRTSSCSLVIEMSLQIVRVSVKSQAFFLIT